METYRFGILYIREKDKFLLENLDTAFDAIPDEKNDEIVYRRKPVPTYVTLKPTRFIEE